MPTLVDLNPSQAVRLYNLLGTAPPSNGKVDLSFQETENDFRITARNERKAAMLCQDVSGNVHLTSLPRRRAEAHGLRARQNGEVTFHRTPHHSEIGAFGTETVFTLPDGDGSLASNLKSRAAEAFAIMRNVMAKKPVQPGTGPQIP